MKAYKFIAIAIVFLATACGRKDYMEYFGIGYSDVVEYIVHGYQTHWDGMNPSETDLSDVYRYESIYGGTQNIDINGDEVQEMVLGDQFEDGSYILYDIYTFDKKTGETIHLLSGGERDYFVLNSDGVIIEHGSNSASDSFDKSYVLKGTKLVELNEMASDESLMELHLDRFLRYVAPNSVVALKEGRVLGQLYKILDDSYVIEAQDTASVSKEGVEIEIWSACDGKGVVFLNDPGKINVYENNDTTSPVLGEAVYEEGYCPETYRCLGYLPGWFKIKFETGEGFVQEELCSWDFEDRF